MNAKIQAYDSTSGRKWLVDAAFSHNGRFHRLRKRGFSTKKEAEAAARIFELQILTGQIPPEPAEKVRSPNLVVLPDARNDLTLQDVFDRLQVYWQGRLQPTTMRCYESAFKCHLARFGRLTWATLPQHVLDAIAAGYGANCFRAILRASKRIGAPDLTGIWNPPVGLKPQRVQFLEPAEAAAIAEHLRMPYRSLFWFLLGTGCRIQEALGLEWKDIDLPRGLVHVDKQLCSASGKLRLPKSKKSRTVPLSQTARRALEMMERNPGHIFPWTGTAFREALHAAGEAAGIQKRVHPHLLRHSAASWIVQSGIPLEVVGCILGHSSPTTTLCYSHLRPEHLRSGVDALDAMATV